MPENPGTIDQLHMKKGGIQMSWKQLLQQSIRSAEALKEPLGLTDEETKKMQAIIDRYPLCINPYYMGLIDPSDPDDPIRKMAVPDLVEFSLGGAADTSGEGDNTVVRGLQHKYRQTVMLLSTDQCAMYCRHCFRKRLVGTFSEEASGNLPEIAAYIRKHPEINNVLISGGDAFINTNEVLARYLECFSRIGHLDFIRFGTRTPVVLPQRITQDPELLDLLEYYCQKKQIIIVTQFNHPKELTGQAWEAVELLRTIGCAVRNQTVLLRGVNDRPDVMAELMNRLVSFGVLPYYIFQCRPVEGVKNQFQVPLTDGIRIIDEARSFMNGQAKNARYALSHVTGKIEILGEDQDGQMIFKYHQAKDKKDHARIFKMKLETNQAWLDQIPPC